MDYIVARHSPQAGLIEPLRRSFSVHTCERGKEVGIKPSYDSREAAAVDAERLTAYVARYTAGCLYLATLAR